MFAFCDSKFNTKSIKYILSVGPTFVIMKFIQCKSILLMISRWVKVGIKDGLKMIRL